MPKYYDFKIAGYYLYFTSFCTVECMHVHASDEQLSEGDSGWLFVKRSGGYGCSNPGQAQGSGNQKDTKLHQAER